MPLARPDRSHVTLYDLSQCKDKHEGHFLFQNPDDSPFAALIVFLMFLASQKISDRILNGYGFVIHMRRWNLLLEFSEICPHSLEMELIYKPIILTWVFTFGRYCILRGRLGNQNRPMKIMTSSMFAFEGPSVGHFSAGEFVYSDGNVVTGSRRQIPISRAFCGSSARAHFTRHLPPISMGGCSSTEVGRDKRHKTAIILHVKCMIRWRNSFSLARRALKGSNQYAPCAVHTVHYGPGQQASYSALRMYNDPWGGKRAITYCRPPG